jgi:hypothetical protein
MKSSQQASNIKAAQINKNGRLFHQRKEINVINIIIQFLTE